MSQGSVLEPQHFTIYINDLDEGTEGMVAKFAADTKIAEKANCEEDIRGLQRDIDRLSEWAKLWQI